MPLPMIALPILIAAGGVGAGFAGKGAADMAKAKKRVRAARERHELACALMEEDRLYFNAVAAAYGQQQLHAADTTVRRFLRLLHRLGQSGRTREAEMLRRLDITPATIDECCRMIDYAGSVLHGSSMAVGTGSAASGAAVGLVGLLGSASTGTAISGLSGAAAQSAVLAWLGGGSLATGGGGMALGSMVLGGIAVAPALLVGGFMLAAQGEKAKAQAQEYSAEVDRACARLELLRALLAAGEHRIEELSGLLEALVSRADVALAQAERHPTPARLQRAALLVRGVVDLLRTPIFDARGNLSNESVRVAMRCAHLLN